MATKKKAAPKKAAAKKPVKQEWPVTGAIEIVVHEVAGLPLGYARKGDRPDVHPDVAARLVAEGKAKRV